MSYRIRYKLFHGWEPQQKYTMGRKDETKWFPLNKDGYWLEPDAFNEGIITANNYFSRDEAKRILLKAQRINTDNWKLAQ